VIVLRSFRDSTSGSNDALSHIIKHSFLSMTFEPFFFPLHVSSSFFIGRALVSKNQDSLDDSIELDLYESGLLKFAVDVAAENVPCLKSSASKLS